MKQKLYSVTQYGKRLDGKYGITGIIHNLTMDEVIKQKANAAKRGQTVSVSESKQLTDSNN